MKTKTINKPIMIALIGLILSVGANFALAEGPIDSYSSGYKHGCADAKTSNFDDRYINQHGKGMQFHTKEFMNGYWAGMEACPDANGDHEDEGYQVTSSNTNPFFSGSYQTISNHHNDDEGDDDD